MKEMWVMGASIIAILPVLLIKLYNQTNDLIYIVLSLFMYLMLIVAYVNLFKLGEVSTMYTILQISQLLIITCAGFVLWGERFDMYKIIGIGLGIGSIYFLAKN